MTEQIIPCSRSKSITLRASITKCNCQSFSSRNRLTYCCVFFANQWRTLSNKSQKLDLSILIQFFKPFRSSSSNSLIRAWYAPQHHLRSSDTHVLTQQDILLFVFIFFIPVAKMMLEAVMMRVRFCILDMFLLCFASNYTSIPRPH